MSRKGYSFLFPFSISFVISISVGLSLIYFGYYRPRISQARLVLDTQNSAAPAIEKVKNDHQNPSEESIIKKTGAAATKRETPVPKDDEVKESLEQPGKSARKQNSEVEGDKKDAASFANGFSKNGGKTSGISAGNARGRHNPPPNRTADLSADNNSERSPAFPKSETSSNDSLPPTESTGNTSIGAEEGPDDNPLIRALREAGKRKKEGAEPPPQVTPGKNPFEFIFDKNK